MRSDACERETTLKCVCLTQTKKAVKKPNSGIDRLISSVCYLDRNVTFNLCRGISSMKGHSVRGMSISVLNLVYNWILIAM